MKASLPFKYITAVKGGKHYVVFDYKDNEGKRKRKWVGTDLPENCKKKELSAKIDEIVADFYKEYISGNIVKSEKAVKMRISEDGQSLMNTLLTVSSLILTECFLTLSSAN